MRLLLLMIVITTITGCGWLDRAATTFTGNASMVCMDGVTYYQFTSGATVAVDRDGKPKKCGL